MKKTLLFLSILMILLGCSEKKISKEQEGWIRDYSFCSCFEFSIGNEIKQQIRQVDFSRAMLFDISDVGYVYKIIDSLAMKESKKIKPTQIKDYKNKKPIIAKCLEFSRSKKIDSMILLIYDNKDSINFRK